MNKEIILIGPIGAGKTTIGELLAKKLEIPQVSMDDIRFDYYKEIGYDKALAEKSGKLVEFGVSIPIGNLLRHMLLNVSSKNTNIVSLIWAQAIRFMRIRHYSSESRKFWNHIPM